jgi:hypothetical protein
MRVLRVLVLLAIASWSLGCRSTDMRASTKVQAGQVRLRHLGVELGDVYVSAKVQVSVD